MELYTDSVGDAFSAVVFSALSVAVGLATGPVGAAAFPTAMSVLGVGPQALASFIDNTIATVSSYIVKTQQQTNSQSQVSVLGNSTLVSNNSSALVPSTPFSFPSTTAPLALPMNYLVGKAFTAMNDLDVTSPKGYFAKLFNLGCRQLGDYGMWYLWTSATPNSGDAISGTVTATVFEGEANGQPVLYPIASTTSPPAAFPPSGGLGVVFQFPQAFNAGCDFAEYPPAFISTPTVAFGIPRDLATGVTVVPFFAKGIAILSNFTALRKQEYGRPAAQSSYNVWPEPMILMEDGWWSVLCHPMTQGMTVGAAMSLWSQSNVITTYDGTTHDVHFMANYQLIGTSPLSTGDWPTTLSSGPIVRYDNPSATSSNIYITDEGAHAIQHMGGCYFQTSSLVTDIVAASLGYFQTGGSGSFHSIGEYLAMRPDSTASNQYRYRDPSFYTTSTEFISELPGGLLYQITTN
jgi:hypothetical protein